MTEPKTHVFLFGVQDLHDILAQHAVDHLGLEPGTYDFVLGVAEVEGKFVGLRIVARTIDNVHALVKTRPLAKCGLREPELLAPENDSARPGDDPNG